MDNDKAVAVGLFTAAAVVTMLAVWIAFVFKSGTAIIFGLNPAATLVVGGFYFARRRP